MPLYISQLNWIRTSMVILFFYCGFSSKTSAQYFLKSRITNNPTSVIDLPNGEYKSTKTLELACKKTITKLQLKGFAGANLDSLIEIDSNHFEALFFVGQKLRWQKLGAGNVPKESLAELRYPKDSFKDDNFYVADYYSIADDIVKLYEERGYPFASVRLVNLKLIDQKIQADLFLDRGRLFKMDTLDIRGNANISKNFLYSYLGFKPGDPYKESIITTIDQKLLKLPFLRPKSQTRVYFLFNKAHLVLDLQNRKTDRIDGIVGLAPNSTASDNQDLLLTGEVNIDLNNILGSAKGFDLRWKSFGERSQELKIGTTLPYLFQSSMGLDGFAEFYKYDTLTINIKSGIGLQYLFEGTNFVRFFYENSLSILQTIDTNSIRNSKTIPITNPVKIRSYGLDLLLERLDYNINPRKGFSLKTKIGFGNKIIEKDDRIEEVVFQNAFGEEYNVYDSVNLKLTTANLDYEFAWFIPLATKSVFVPSIRGKHILSDQIFFDELFRIGGNNDLRGFDEKAIQASSYHIYQLEYRYLISRNSYFNTFFNGAYYQNRSQNNDIEDFPIGFGVGVNLEVSSGLLSLAYALGKEQGNPIQLNQSKIHFGIVSFL